MERRTFLGAAAAVASISLPGDDSGGESATSEYVEEDSVSDGGDYRVTDLGAVPGGLGDANVYPSVEESEIEVEAVYEKGGWCGVSLRWDFGSVQFGSGLDPDDALELAERLQVAAQLAVNKDPDQPGDHDD